MQFPVFFCCIQVLLIEYFNIYAIIVQNGDEVDGELGETLIIEVRAGGGKVGAACLCSTTMISCWKCD